MGALPERLITPVWPAPFVEATPAPPPIPAMLGDATDATWALGHPEKIIDFGYRGIHEMSVQAKAVIAAFYGKAPQHSYFASCSDGGREALMEAQRFPDDYDGIVAGAPANFWTHLVAGAAWNSQALLADPPSYIPAAKLPAISAAAIAACDAKDGLTDELISDPAACHFDPARMQCKGPESDTCLTEPQVAALKKIYAGPRLRAALRFSRATCRAANSAEAAGVPG